MGGVDDIKPFLALLLEDPEVDEIGKVITPSYTDFIEKDQDESVAISRVKER